MTIALLKQGHGCYSTPSLKGGLTGHDVIADNRRCAHHWSMKTFRNLGLILATLMTGPLIFGVVMSVQEGCFLCLEGDLAGSELEIWLNLGLLLVLVSAIALPWRSRRRRRGSTE